jgi:16S rRNA (guanine966-N2)-methyltransferase
MRIVAGKFRGRSIASPQHDGTRPTSDRVREAVFNILSNGAHPISFDGMHVLDLFAGTGALGLEALSRGAATCMFVDDSADARGVIRDNVEAFGLTGVTKIFRRDATGLGEAGKYGGKSLVFLDPPYGKGLAELALMSAGTGGWLIDGAIVVIEERKGVGVTLPADFVGFDRRSWGDTQVTFARYTRVASTKLGEDL